MEAIETPTLDTPRTADLAPGEITCHSCGVGFDEDKDLLRYMLLL
jgi:hypothetical protein